MDATCTIQDSIHVFNLVHKYVSRILGTYHSGWGIFSYMNLFPNQPFSSQLSTGGIFILLHFLPNSHPIISTTASESLG